MDILGECYSTCIKVLRNENIPDSETITRNNSKQFMRFKNKNVMFCNVPFNIFFKKMPIPFM